MSEDDEWDSEVVETQDRYNVAKFDSTGANALEREAAQEEKEKAQAVQIAREKQEDLGFTAKREAMKRADKARIKGNAVKKVPSLEEEEVTPVPTFKPTNNDSVGAGGGRLKIQDPELKAFFEESENKRFSEQAVDFLNA